MPPPRRPNVTKAAEARRRIGLETMAAKLRAAGYDVQAPDTSDDTSTASQLRAIAEQLAALSRQVDAITRSQENQ